MRASGNLFSVAGQMARVFGRKKNRNQSVVRRSVIEILESRVLLSANYIESTLANFGSTDNAIQSNNLTSDANGNIYGVTGNGGTFGDGTVFEIASGTHSLTTLATFNGTNGSSPNALAFDAQGNLWGTTSGGGAGGDGTVFEIRNGSNAISTIAAFSGADGQTPFSNLAFDSQGNLYGATEYGGAGDGVIYEILAGTHTRFVIHSFSGADGAAPNWVLPDSSGGIYGTTLNGGIFAGSFGTVFELAPLTRDLTPVVNFAGLNGANPSGRLVEDAAGNLYGTTENGGSGGDGTIFEVAATTRIVKDLISFGADNGPNQGPINIDNSGNLYGTVVNGYTGLTPATTVFEIAAGTHKQTTLFTFTGTNSDSITTGNIQLVDSNIDFYGIGSPGSSTYGAVYELQLIPQLTFASSPGTTTAGHVLSPTTVVDITGFFNQIITNDDSAVTLSAVGPGGLLGTVTVNAVNGVATFNNVYLDTSGSYQLQASDGPDYIADSAPFTVNPGPAKQLVFAAEPPNGKPDQSLNPPVVVYDLDQYGNIVRTNTSKVTLSVETGPGAVSGTATVALNNGAAVFSNLLFDAPGTYTLIAKDGTLTPVISYGFLITAQYQLVFAAPPTDSIAGSILNPVVVYLMDYQGNIIRNNNSIVTLSEHYGLGPMSGTTSVALNNGAAIFSNLSFTTASEYTLVARDATFAPIVSPLFRIRAAAVAHLAFGQNPTNVVAGVHVMPAITVKATDIYGNVVSGAIVTLSVDTGPAGGGIFGALTGTTNTPGFAVFGGVSFHTVGTYTLTASVGAVSTGKSASFTVSPAAASKLVFTTLPSTPAHGTAFTVKVSVEDVYGNILTTQNSGTITLAASTHPTGATLAGTLTAKVVNGVATFSNLSVNLAGAYKLTASDSFGIASATSASIVVS